MGLVSFKGTAIMGMRHCRRRCLLAATPSASGRSRHRASQSLSSRCWYTSTEPLSSASSSASSRTFDSRKLSSSATVCLMSFLFLLLFLPPPTPPLSPPPSLPAVALNNIRTRMTRHAIIITIDSFCARRYVLRCREKTGVFICL